MIAFFAASVLALPLETARGEQDAETLKARIDEIAVDSAWSRIPWKTCLVDAYEQARREKKPVLLWALGGDPEGRC